MQFSNVNSQMMQPFRLVPHKNQYQTLEKIHNFRPKELVLEPLRLDSRMVQHPNSNNGRLSHV